MEFTLSTILNAKSPTPPTSMTDSRLAFPSIPPVLDVLLDLNVCALKGELSKCLQHVFWTENGKKWPQLWQNLVTAVMSICSWFWFKLCQYFHNREWMSHITVKKFYLSILPFLIVLQLHDWFAYARILSLSEWIFSEPALRASLITVAGSRRPCWL